MNRLTEEMVKTLDKYLVKPVQYRVLIETSPMSNNDERIMVTDTCDPEAVLAIAKLKFDLSWGGHISLIRPIFKSELVNGFRDRGESGPWAPKEPEITMLLDACFRIKNMLSCVGGRHDLSSAVAMYVGTSYYDCMSGGMPKWDVALCKWLAERPGIRKEEDVYPRTGKDGEPEKWYNLGDWLNDIGDDPNLDVEKVLGAGVAGMLLLGENT